MNQLVKRRNGKLRSERGSILAMSAISMLALLLAVGLCVDISHMYLVGTELQNAADAAALAGASALDSTAGGIHKAVDRAVETMNKYEFNRTDVTIGDGDVSFADELSDFDNDGAGMSEATASASDTTAATIRFVRVKIPNKSINIFFAGLALGGSAVNLSRQAVAGQSVALNRFCNVAPLSVVQKEGGANLASPDCPSIAKCCSSTFVKECSYVVRLGTKGEGGGQGKDKKDDDTSGAVSPGNYLILAFNGDTGGANVKEKLALADSGCINIGGNVPIMTEPGIKNGPVRAGLNTRFDIYGNGLKDADWNLYPPDKDIRENITHKQYSEDGFTSTLKSGHVGVFGRRRLLIPIINESEYDQGRNEVHINKLGEFFMKGSVPEGGGGNDSIIMEYIGKTITLGSGGVVGNTPGPDPSLTVAVLYR